ncbi:MAG: prolyl oligopeptidase family serine peptidase, partial [Muribaculaceae bacterium]|nr:prolyl oligopeptidase family serine peptidase [Muribaculaceae bacterium]
TAGKLTLVTAAGQPSLHTFSTRLRALRLSKGKQKLTTNGRGEILVNGKSLAKKVTSDSIASDVSGEITLNPEADNEIQVKILSMPEDGASPEFKVEYIPEDKFKEIAVEEGADISRRFSTLGTMTGERVTKTSISPDGKYIIVNYSERFSKQDSESRTELIETQTGKVISGDLNKSANWMPKGSKIYYTVKGAGGYTLYTMDVPSLKSEIIARNVPDANFFFTPDMRYVIYNQYVEGKKESGPTRRLLNPDDRIPGDRDRYYIMRYDLVNGVETPLTYGGPSTYISDITRDGKYLLYSTSTFIASEYPMYFNDFIQLDLTTLRTDTIFRHDGYINSAVYSPDARQLFICGAAQAFDGIAAEVGNHPIPNEYDIQGYIYTIADKKVIPVTKNFRPSLDNRAVWNPADGNIYFRANEGFGINLYRLNPKNIEISKLTTETQVVYSFSIGDDESNWITYTGGDFYNTGIAYLLNLKTGKSRLIADPMKSELADVEFGKMEEWNFTASDGTEINGYACLPPNFDPSKKYPLIVYYYGGTSPSLASITTPYSPQVFASRDYVVYILNPSGTYGYGQEFAARHVNAWGKRTAEDIIEGVKTFCKAHPFVNDKKIGCCGASYGGFMTQYLQTLTDIFAAAVSHAGISNVTSYWGEGYWGYSYNKIAAAKSYPWT